jgi:hypothetical protein
MLKIKFNANIDLWNQMQYICSEMVERGGGVLYYIKCLIRKLENAINWKEKDIVVGAKVTNRWERDWEQAESQVFWELEPMALARTSLSMEFIKASNSI